MRVSFGCRFQFIFYQTDDDMRLARNVNQLTSCLVVVISIDISIVMTHASLPSAAIDVTRRTALNIGSGTGDKVTLNTQTVLHGTGSTGSIEVFHHLTAQEVDIGRTIYITAMLNVAMSQTTAIAVATYGSTIIDMDVGVVILRPGIINRM